MRSFLDKTCFASRFRGEASKTVKIRDTIKSAVAVIPGAKQTGPMIRGFYNRRIAPVCIRKEIARSAGELRVVLGASGKVPDGWIGTDVENLNLLREEDWLRFFQPGTIRNLLAEHVWEHLSWDEGLRGAKLCAKFLRHGGRLRIAVPDGNFPSEEYLRKVRPPADGHQMLYTVEILSDLLSQAGLSPSPLEYWDSHGEFQQRPWDETDGLIMRSAGKDPRNSGGKFGYTSLIMDGKR